MRNGKAKSEMIDLHLTILEGISRRGYCWEAREMGEICGVHHSTFQDLERRALQRFNKLLEVKGIAKELR
jgi:hypothetical protein